MQKFRFFQPAKLRSSWHVALLLIVLLSLVSCGGGGGSSSSSTDTSSTTTTTYTLQGTISPGSVMAFDSDTNDPDASSTSNDTIAAAQTVFAPGTVSGYVARDTEKSDFYVAEMTAGQSIVLRFPDADAANLDLNLFTSSGNLLDSSAGTGSSETLTVSDTDTYYIEVYVNSDTPGTTAASIYTLTITNSTTSRGVEEMHLSDDFVPGDIIVRLKDTSASAAALSTTATLADKAAELGLQGFAGKPTRAMRMGFRSTTKRNQAFSKLGLSNNATFQALALSSSSQADKLATIRLVQALRQRADVASASLNYYRYATQVPDDTYYSSEQTWNYELINLPAAWNITTGSDAVIVAVIDTGVLLNHPDLGGRLVDGYDFISDPSISLDGDGIDSNPDDPGDKSEDDGSSSFHGTHVAGTIAAATNNTAGVAGITWSGKIMPLRALGHGGGTTYDILQAVRYAAGLDNDSGTRPEQTADIINLSLGSDGYTLEEQTLYTKLHDELGIIIVAAAGNDSAGTVSYPAACEDVVAVSAVDENGELAYYSNYGTALDVAAPGGSGYTNRPNVYSTCGDDSNSSQGIQYTYCSMAGTSMATPHVAGVAALLKGAYPNLTAADFDALLQNGDITDASSTGHSNYYGYGIIDAYQAVSWAQDNQTVPTTLQTDPESLDFDNFESALTVEVYLNGSAASGTISATVNASWLSIKASDVNSLGVGTYTLTANRNALSPGNYTATLTFSSSNENITALEVPVSMTVLADTTAVSGGLFHISLYNSQTHNKVAETLGTFSNGSMDFALSGVPSGSYHLFAGTDIDGDEDSLDGGEVLGGYGSSVTRPTLITVNSNLASLDFYVYLNSMD